ncbi:endonuclease III domain-containing protein [Deinococcus arcticus]|uniref:Fe-S cluster assembly protein HesB n=1 Tax=Deinococcus arcticus TaxID=2136176 RepID=A0A2T3W8H8_9DEIO|nr:Fe-S cluster assembly protein HesB [Deinococcus arcticus]PTA68208.1 Fe-S cluster assembly protein HesB [Deinococcus arcticus]
MPRPPEVFAVPESLPEVTRRLVAEYLPEAGPGPRTRPAELLNELIRTILGQQNTRDAAGRQFRALKAAYGRWEAALLDGPDGIEATLKAAGGGLHRAKAAHLHGLLSALAGQAGDEDRALGLDGLATLDDEGARAALQRLPGVGRHTANLMLLFDLGRAAMPVEGHLDRLARRLGWVPDGWAGARVERWYDSVTPRTHGARWALHVGGVRHGRATCTPRHPRCDHCVLADLCPSAALLGPGTRTPQTAAILGP